MPIASSSDAIIKPKRQVGIITLLVVAVAIAVALTACAFVFSVYLFHWLSYGPP